MTIKPKLLAMLIAISFTQNAQAVDISRVTMHGNKIHYDVIDNTDHSTGVVTLGQNGLVSGVTGNYHDRTDQGAFTALGNSFVNTNIDQQGVTQTVVGNRGLNSVPQRRIINTRQNIMNSGLNGMNAGIYGAGAGVYGATAGLTGAASALNGLMAAGLIK